MNNFLYGIKKGIPIAFGYLSVSFTFGIMAVNGGLPVWTAVLISFTNLTSAGQFAGTSLLIAGGSYIEIAVSTFVINIRYMLMSLALSQKINSDTPLWKRLIFGFSITDEIFAVSVAEHGKIDASYMFGLMSLPIAGWTLGTAAGAAATKVMPEIISNAMGLGLYAMFIAIIIPPAKKHRSVLTVILLAVAIECMLYYAPVFSWITSGFKVIAATITAAVCGAILFPIEEGDRE